MANIVIDWVEEPIKVTVDMSKLTWGDVLDIQKTQASDDGRTAEEKSLEVIQRVVTKVTGIEATELPAQAFGEVLNAIMERVNGDPAKN